MARHVYGVILFGCCAHLDIASSTNAPFFFGGRPLAGSTSFLKPQRLTCAQSGQFHRAWTDKDVLGEFKLSTPGVEPGLSRPQRDVLTTRRCGHGISLRRPHWPDACCRMGCTDWWMVVLAVRWQHWIDRLLSQRQPQDQLITVFPDDQAAHGLQFGKTLW